MFGKMSTGVRRMARGPRMKINSARTRKVYGRWRAILTIHIGVAAPHPQRNSGTAPGPCRAMAEPIAVYAYIWVAICPSRQPPPPFASSGTRPRRDAQARAAWRSEARIQERESGRSALERQALVIGDAEQDRPEGGRLLRPEDILESSLRPIPKELGLAQFGFSLPGQDDPPLAAINFPLQHGDESIAFERL